MGALQLHPASGFNFFPACHSNALSATTLTPLAQVKVADRAAIVTTDAETRVAEPRGLQAAIDAAVAGVPRGRSFVRPSGTEDVVRVYAEAESQEAADALAIEVARLVHAKAGGVGPAP